MDETEVPECSEQQATETDGKDKPSENKMRESLSFLEDRSQFHVEAFYHDPELEIPEYRGNPLILALPPFTKRIETATKLRQLHEIPHSDEYRTWSPELRIMALSRIARNIVVQPAHVKLLEWCHQQMRQHYHRSPTLGAPPDLQERYMRQQRGSIEILEEPQQSHSSSLAVIGMSGVGKSTLGQLVLNQFPRVIYHREFDGKPFRGAQLVYLYDVCPHNSSVGALCRSLLAQVDAHLGTFYEKEMMHRRVNTADYVAKLTAVLKHHAVGLLVIDEIQNALVRQEERQMLDLLVNMLNSRACPALFLGTPETALIAPKKSRLLRRIGAHEVRLDPFRKGNNRDAKVRDWFLESVTRLDFLPTPFINKAQVYDALMSVSAGVPAFITHAWMIAQYAGITSEKQVVTPELIHAATKPVFGMVSGLLRAIEKRDYKTLAIIGDAAIGLLRERITNWISDRESDETQAAIAEQGKVNVFYAAVRTLMELGIGKGDAEREVGIVQQDSSDVDAKELVRRVLDKYRKVDFGQEVGSGKCDTTVPAKRDHAQGTREAQPEAEEGVESAEKSAVLGSFRAKRRDAVEKGSLGKKAASSIGERRPLREEVSPDQWHPASEEVI